MEAIIALLLVISTLTACSGKAPTASQPAEEPTLSMKENAVLSEAAPQTLRYQVDLVTYEDSVSSDDGTELANCSFQYPVMTVCWQDGTAVEKGQTTEEEQALAAAEAFNDQFGPETVEEEFQEMAALAWDDLSFRQESGLEWTSPYTMEMDCSVYQTGQMVSVSAEYYSYTGGAHPNTVLLAWNFDLTTGQFFTAEVLAADGQAFSDAVHAEIMRQSRLVAAENDLTAEEFFWPNYEEITASWSSYAVSFDESGMTVGFSPYELAAYAMGSQVYHLSYEQLMPYLSSHGLELLGLEDAGQGDEREAVQS